MAEREHFTNGRCAVFGTGLALVIAAFGAQVAGWPHWIFMGITYGVGIALMFIASFLIGKSYYATHQLQMQPLPAAAMPGIPTLSALLGQNPNVQFNPKQFFALAHYSPLTAEMEANIKLIAQQYSPNDREGFYAKFIGVGAIAYHHEMTWITIFGSQLLALDELNSRGLIPISDVKKHYAKAASQNQNFYKTYPFGAWFKYMKERYLIADYPSQMVELSFGGKDFLKYVAHTGKTSADKKN